ncbi:MAG: proline--tRNA ligase [Deltaproteobacteria bacterium]|nr:MAG: proline--tRNA ligase [Deltaproteobacteria bacterium]
MRYSKVLIPTLREEPAEAEVVSHKLMLRAGMIRKLAAGVYNYLPLGLRVIRKVEQIIREEMDRSGALEVLMPWVQPAELWEESGRWEDYGKELLRFQDRHERWFCLGPTHEEVITDIVRKDVRSYRQLPLNLYQIQTKFRDEIRPRFGLMRGREFGMKDAYSFDADEQGAEESYRVMFDTYCRIFARCGLKFRAVEAETGPIGGSFSHEFMVLAETGEDIVVSCDSCDYAANLEKAEIERSKTPNKEKAKPKPLELVSTPGMKTVEEVCGFLKVKPQSLVKTLIYQGDSGPIAALVRGDHEINETKLRRLVGCERLELASEEVIEQVSGAPLGFAGPVGLKMRLIADQGIEDMVNFVTGANKADAHLVNVNLGRDFQVEELSDVRVAREGDPCPRCEGKLLFNRGIEVGHVFKLGTKYSKALKATYLDEQGTERLIIMGCYGIGVGRTAAAAIEQHHDDKGIIFPPALAPFQVLILPVNVKEERLSGVAENIHHSLEERGIEVLLDDRDERPGVKFKDADLIGIPLRVTLGNRFIKEGVIELKWRWSEEIDLVREEDMVDEVLKRLKSIKEGGDDEHS